MALHPNNYLVLARLDWFRFLIYTFPVQLVEPFIFLFSPYPALSVSALFIGVVQYFGIMLLYILCSILVDFFRGIDGIPVAPVPSQIADKLTESLRVQGLLHPALKVSRIRCNVSDITMGAHIRGVIWPSVVISGGLMVGLLRKDKRAAGILCHEIAHIEHYDRLLPGVIGLTLIEIFGSLSKFLTGDAIVDLGPGVFWASFFAIIAYKAIVLGGALSCISRYREFYADARAMYLSKDPEAYVSVLESALISGKSSGFSIFHPRLSSRIKQARNGFPVLRRIVFWRLYLAISSCVSFAQWKLTDDTDVAMYAFSGFCVTIFLLVTEPLRSLFIGVPRHITQHTSAGLVQLAVFGSTVEHQSQSHASDNESVSGRPKPNDFEMPVAEPLDAAKGFGKSVFRYIFLLSGFAFVIFVGNEYGGQNSEMIVSVGGGVVYAIFYALRD